MDCWWWADDRHLGPRSQYTDDGKTWAQWRDEKEEKAVPPMCFRLPGPCVSISRRTETMCGGQQTVISNSLMAIDLKRDRYYILFQTGNARRFLRPLNFWFRWVTHPSVWWHPSTFFFSFLSFFFFFFRIIISVPAFGSKGFPLGGLCIAHSTYYSRMMLFESVSFYT